MDRTSHYASRVFRRIEGGCMNGVPWNRREFLRAAAAAGVACTAWSALADSPPEVTTIRLVHDPAICLVPQYLAEELLRVEGFSKIEYVELSSTGAEAADYMLLVQDKADMTMDFPSDLLPAIDAGRPLTVLAGIHGGCFELFAHGAVQTVRDLKGRRVAITVLGSGEHVYIAAMMAYVGMDPAKDVAWVEARTEEGMMRAFADQKVDAVLLFPPQPQKLRELKIGHVIVDTSRDRPWSQYFCCMLAARPDFVRRHPVATKRALRSMLKATDVCAREPERAARYLVDKGYESSYAIAREVLAEVSFNAWRVFDPETTLRFHALRLHEVGILKKTPEKLLSQCTDWRFLNELKRELKA